MSVDSYRVHAEAVTDARRIAIATPDFSGYTSGRSGIVTRLVAQFSDATSVARWFAYIGTALSPDDLADSSQGDTLPSWSPSLVNGQPLHQGERLSIVAIDADPGSRILVSSYIALEAR